MHSLQEYMDLLEQYRAKGEESRPQMEALGLTLDRAAFFIEDPDTLKRYAETLREADAVNRNTDHYEELLTTTPSPYYRRQRLTTSPCKDRPRQKR